MVISPKTMALSVFKNILKSGVEALLILINLLLKIFYLSIMENGEENCQDLIEAHEGSRFQNLDTIFLGNLL